jgi:hypothetical protein
MLNIFIFVDRIDHYGCLRDGIVFHSPMQINIIIHLGVMAWIILRFRDFQIILLGGSPEPSIGSSMVKL